MGIVDSVGPAVKTLKKGDRVVASFDLGCDRVNASPPSSPKAVLACGTHSLHLF